MGYILTYMGSGSSKHRVWRNFLVSVNCIHGNSGYFKMILDNSYLLRFNLC